MATILIVDDREVTRSSLATLLGHRRHRVVQARDGREALELARRERPHLVISDILMPHMDGYELVRQLRADAAIAATPIVFSTAQHLSREARRLAAECGVAIVLEKPCAPETVLHAVDVALQQPPGGALATSNGALDTRRPLVDRSGEPPDELQAMNAKLTALMELNQQLAFEPDAQRLFGEFTRGTRDIVGARMCVVARCDPERDPEPYVFTAGLELGDGPAPPGSARRVLLDTLRIVGRGRRHSGPDGVPVLGLPGVGTVRSLLATGIASLTRAYGWVWVLDKVGFEAFSEADERLMQVFGGQLGRIYENGRLYRDLSRRTAELEALLAAHRRAEERTAALLAVAQDLAGTLDLERMLDCAHHHTVAMVPCDAVGTFVFDERRQVFRLIGQRAMSDALLAAAAAAEVHRSAFDGRTSGGGEAAAYDLHSAPPELRALAERGGMGAMIAAPLRTRDRMRGALIAFRSPTAGPFGADQVELCAGIAKQLALAMEAVDLHRAQQEEARVAGGLATVATELFAALGDPRLLERLCEVTARVFQAEIGDTMLRRSPGLWCHVAGWGWRPEEHEVLRTTAVPARVIDPLVAALERGEVVFDARWLPDEWLTVPRRFGLSTLVAVPLRGDGEVIGILFAAWRDSPPAIGAEQFRIARGLGLLASLALDNLRLIERLDSANRLKSEFVSTMSHELRTPLNVIIGYADLLRAAEFGPLTDEQRDVLERMDGQANQLLALVNATLDVGRLETQGAALELGEAPVAALLEELRAEAPQKPSVEVVWPVATRDVRLVTDRGKLTVLLRNVIDNAIKFTDAGRVDIDVQRAGKSIVFTVRDTGIGIPAESLETIFEWRQLEPSATRRHGGIGLGLYLARRLAEVLGASISVESAVGRGSTFRIEVPARGPDHGR